MERLRRRFWFARPAPDEPPTPVIGRFQRDRITGFGVPMAHVNPALSSAAWIVVSPTMSLVLGAALHAYVPHTYSYGHDVDNRSRVRAAVLAAAMSAVTNHFVVDVNDDTLRRELLDVMCPRCPLAPDSRSRQVTRAIQIG